MPNPNPFWPKHSCLFKGFGDFVNMRAITNPIGNLKDSISDLHNGPNGFLESGARMAGLGAAIRPTNLNRYTEVYLNPNKAAYGYPGEAGNDKNGRTITKVTALNSSVTPTGGTLASPVQQTGNKLPSAVIASIFDSEADSSDQRGSQPIL